MFVIAGVTGHTGAVVANTLLAQKLPVRVIVRDATKGADWKAKGAEVAVADLTDATALTAALKGATGAYLLVPPTWTATDFVANGRKHLESFKAALTANNVPHAVFLSSIAAQKTSGTGPIMTSHTVETELKGIKTHLTFLRAGYFMENLLGSLAPMKSDGVLPAFFSADRTFNMVATPDIGAEAAALLRLGTKAPAMVELGTPYTLNQAAEAFSAALGKTIKIAPVPAAAHVATFKSFGLSDLWANGYAEMNNAVETGNMVPEGTVKATLISLNDFAKSAVAGAQKSAH